MKRRAFQAAHFGGQRSVRVKLQPAPARRHRIEGEIGAVRLELNAGRRRRHHTSAIPVEIQFLMNMAAQQMLHPRPGAQRAVQRAGVAQTVLIQPAAAGRQRMMMQQK